jgi:uncharacterized protein (TIGR02145 family)
MFCSNCGKNLEDDANFCPKCGKKVVGNTPTPSDIKGSFTDPRDGRVYKTVKIGEQVWMAENLAYDAPGSIVNDCDPDNFEKYGLLYGWKTALNACPPGWHLPNDEEWDALVDFVGGGKIAGKKLKAKSGWMSSEGKPGGGTDDFSFSALPGACGFSDGYCCNVGDYGYWWSAGHDGNKACCRIMLSGRDIVGVDYHGKLDLCSVRCVQDYPQESNTAKLE